MFWNRSKKTKKTDQPSGLGKTTPITENIPSSFFQSLVPVGDMPDYEIQQFELRESRHVSGDVIFDHDEDSYSVPYLLKGQCYVETLNGSGYLVKAGSFKALYPLSNGQLFQCNVIAKSKVTIVHFPANILSLTGQHIRNPLLNSQDIPKNLVDNQFFDDFCRYFNQDKLIIPSLPNVAIKLREAIQKEIGIHEAVKIINLDSVISSRLIQIVNSPMYRSASAITSSLDAVSRLGLNATRNLVTSICMKNLFRSKNKEINLKMQGLWKQSIHVSSISYTLATLAKNISPDEALLAGLTHNIGAIPILIFADGLSDTEYSVQDLDQTIFALQGIIGSLVLKSWEFPTYMQEMPKNIAQWYGNEDGELDLSDIVLLAKFHSFIGTKKMQKLPPIHTLPAFQKLGNNQLTPDMSLQMLEDAKQKIAETMSIFKA